MKIPDQAIADFVSRKLGIRTCEACGMSAWVKNSTLYELRAWDGNGRGDDDGDERARVPLVALSCGRCGNTKLFDAVTAGLIDG